MLLLKILVYNGSIADNRVLLYFKAIENQHENCAKMLLDARADPTCKDKDGNSSVHCAAKAGMLEIFKELRKSQKVISSGPDHPNSVRVCFEIYSSFPV